MVGDFNMFVMMVFLIVEVIGILQFGVYFIEVDDVFREDENNCCLV